MTSQQKLIEYIKEAQRRQRSRYEVDLELLAQDYLPAQIEAAWQKVLSQPQPLTWQQQVKKVLRRPEWWVLLGLISWFMFLGYFNSGWPAVIMRMDSTQQQVENIFTFFGGLGLLGWSYRLYRAKAPFRIMLIIALLVISGVVIVFVLGGWLTSGFSIREVASARTINNSYHLVVTTGCIESCTKSLTFYRCDKSEANCSNRYYPLDWGSDMSDFQVGNLRIDVNEPGHTARLFTVQNILIWQFDLP